MLNPENFTKKFMAEYSEAALQIAERKMRENSAREAEKGISPFKPRIATGGGFGGIFLWDTCFCIQWAKYAPGRFPVLTSLDNFYDRQDEDGFICREFTADGTPLWSKEHPISCNPPILAWAERDLFEFGITGLDRLKKVYPHLKKHYEFLKRTYRREDGLYFNDALGGGMDYLQRMPDDDRAKIDTGIHFEQKHTTDKSGSIWKWIGGKPLWCWNRQMGWIDFSSQMAFKAKNLEFIATQTGLESDVKGYQQDHAELARIINETCWDEERGFYFDYCEGRIIPRFHAGAFWTLIAEIVPPERVKRMASVFNDEKKFMRPVPLPCLAADDPLYNPVTGHWNGPVWPPTEYITLRGLKKCGQHELARKIAERYYNANAELYRKTGTVFEHISPENTERLKMAGPDFCGWGALAAVAISREFLDFTQD